MDKIIIRELKVNAILGIYDHERTTPQEFVIDLELSTDTKKAGRSDDFADCLDYEKMSNDVFALASNAKRLTVEALAQDVADCCLQHPMVSKVKVKILKTQAIPFTSGVGVQITRKKET
jgi:FolB domain-containing protein